MTTLKTIAAAATIGAALGLAALDAGEGVANAAPTSPGVSVPQDGGWWGGGHDRWDHGGWGPGPGWYGGPGYGYGPGDGYGGPAGGCVSGPLGFVSVCL